jgi:hypothetical protein
MACVGIGDGAWRRGEEDLTWFNNSLWGDWAWRCCAKRFAELDGVPPKTFDKGFEMLVYITFISGHTKLTTLGSVGINFRVVRGVLPRSFPGVLNVSAMFLKSHQ